MLVWTYVEIGVAIVAACLPTLGPLAKSRTVESLVASVRSKIPIHSFGSRSRNGSAENQGRKDTEKGPYSGVDAIYSQSQVVSSKNSDPPPGDSTIRREDSVVVESEPASNTR